MNRRTVLATICSMLFPLAIVGGFALAAFAPSPLAEIGYSVGLHAFDLIILDGGTLESIGLTSLLAGMALSMFALNTPNP